jgi:hypothetical protein
MRFNNQNFHSTTTTTTTTKNKRKTTLKITVIAACYIFDLGVHYFRLGGGAG